jgi:hypothetical protein
MRIATCVLPLVSCSLQLPLRNNKHKWVPSCCQPAARTRTLLSGAPTNWYEIFKEEESEEKARPINPTDMYYNRVNCQRSLERYRALSSSRCTEVWASVANEDRPIVWCVGRVARHKSVPLEECVARQWNLIQQHGLTMRSLRAIRFKEAHPAMECESLDLWCPRPAFELLECDSLDIQIAIRRNGILGKMSPNVPNSKTVRNFLVGFEGEIDMFYKRSLDKDGRFSLN